MPSRYWTGPQPLKGKSSRVWLLLAVGGILRPAGAAAQLTTDQVPRERTIASEIEVGAEMERSHLFGPLHILPRVVLRDAGYDSNVFGSSTNPVSDWTGTVGLGLRLYLPIGGKTYIRGEAIPQYTWYDKLSDRRRWGGVASAGFLGFYNRLSFELSGGLVNDSSFLLNSEVETRVVQKRKDVSAGVELDLSHRISLFANAQLQESRNEPGGNLPPGFPDVSRYDRTDEATRAGIRYRFGPGWDVSVGADATRTLFVQTPEQRDNRSVAPLVGLHYDRPRFYANLYAGYRIGRPDGSSFPAFETPTGSYFASFFVTRVLELQAYGSRHLVYGSVVDNPYYLETRNGGGVNLWVLSRLRLRGYGDYGTNDYSLAGNVSTVAASRTDRGTSFGGGFAVTVYRSAVLSVLATKTNYRSNFEGANRSIFRVTTGLTFEQEFSR
jgi:hypothetical protein